MVLDWIFCFFGSPVKCGLLIQPVSHNSSICLATITRPLRNELNMRFDGAEMAVVSIIPDPLGFFGPLFMRERVDVSLAEPQGGADVPIRGSASEADGNTPSACSVNEAANAAGVCQFSDECGLR